MSESKFDSFVPRDMNEVKSLPSLDVPASESSEEFDARHYIGKQTGMATLYAPSAYTNYTEDQFNLTWTTTANQLTVQRGIGYPEKPLQALYKCNSATSAIFDPSNRGVGWIICGGNVGPMRKFQMGTQYVTGSEQLQQMRLKNNQVSAGGVKGNDVVLTGNTFSSGMGESARPAMGSSSDSLHRIGIRLAQVCMHKAWLGSIASKPMAGVLTNADPGLTGMTGDFSDNTWGASGAVTWGNHDCLLGNCAVYPFGLRYSAAPVWVNIPGPIPNVRQPGTGTFSLVNTRSVCPPDSVASVFTIPPSLFPAFQGQYGKLIAILIILLGPGPHAIHMLSATVFNAVAEVVSTFISNASRIFTAGTADITFYVPNEAQAPFPNSIANAYAGSYYDFYTGPVTDGALPANALLQPSFSANGQNGLYQYSAAGMVRTYYAAISALEIETVARAICSEAGRIPDFEAGIQGTIAHANMYNILHTVDVMGAPQTANDTAGSILDHNVNYDCTRPRDLVNNINGELYPISEPASADYALPDFDLVWLNAVMMKTIVPDPFPGMITWAALLVKSELLQASLYITRAHAMGHQCMYDMVDKPASFWNQIVTTQPVSTNYPATNQVGNLMAWRITNKTRFVCPPKDGGIQYAPGAKEVVRYISGLSGLKLTRDSWGYTWQHYRQYPNYTVPENNGLGGSELVLPFTSGLSYNAQWLDVQCYKPGCLLDFEMYSSMKHNTLRYSQPPLPNTPNNFGLLEGNQLVRTTYKTVPTAEAQLFVMVSDGDLYNTDTFQYMLRTLFAAGYYPVWESNIQAPLVLPRDNTLNVGGQIVGGLTRNLSVDSAFNEGWNFNIESVYLRSNHLPAVDIAGTRGYAWFGGQDSTDVTQWISNKHVIYSNAMVFNKVLNVVNNTLGSGMKLRIMTEEAAVSTQASETKETKTESLATDSNSPLVSNVINVIS